MELAFAFSNRENPVYSERSCLNSWLIQYPFFLRQLIYLIFFTRNIT